MDLRVDRDTRSGVTTVALSGELTAQSSGQVLTALLKYAAECPTVVIADLRGVRLGLGARSGVLATAVRMAMRGHGVPILFVGPDPGLAEQIAAFRMFVHTYPSHAEALRASAARVPRWWHERLPPVRSSPALARDLAGDACQSWGLMHLREPARLVMSELVTNAVQHSGQPFDVTVSYSGVYLRLAVRDQSPVLPRLGNHATVPGAALSDRGRGLALVRSTATNWGALPVPGGKVVWALLGAHPAAATKPAEPDQTDTSHR